MRSTIGQPETKNTVHLFEDPALSSIKAELDNYLKQLSPSADNGTIDKVIALLQKKMLSHEKDIWKSGPAKENIASYQNIFKALEQLHSLKTKDDRYSFKIVIPVADRPQHLKQCLDSLLNLCQNYQYGGIKNKQFSKISVLIADDSKDKENIKRHALYCTELTRAGLTCEYFGLEEQLALVNRLSRNNANLKRIISSTEDIKNPTDFSHKGASIMRNITYLKLNQDCCQDISQHAENKNTLIYFIDSDQEFCINATNDKKYYAINYFHYLNEIFNKKNISILTGKVVGDPPVSPSVMAGNFQQDIKSFLNSQSQLVPEDPCQFHNINKHNGKDDAAYHDMADLFGFNNKDKTYNYCCHLENKHNNADCYYDFSQKLQHFFYGEHPTRKAYFNYENGFTATTPARTVYTGNYVITPEALNYFIPFATLKLRMAGPVLGRILKTKLQHSFVSANLPMLHNRTVTSTGQSEFRAGVKNNDLGIDLGNEFIRQFYGDVMLFAMEEFTRAGFPESAIDADKIQSTLNAIYLKIKQSYIEKHNTILQLKTQISEQLNNRKHWWNTSSGSTQPSAIATSNFNAFLKNIQLNFDENSRAYQEITIADYAQKHLDEILYAITHYQHDLNSWNKALKF